VVLADPSPSGDDASTSHVSAATSTVIAAARAPLLSRAAFIVSFEQHRRTAVRLYLGVQVARFFSSTFFRTQRMLSCCCVGFVHVGLLVRLRRELAYVDCSARASLGPVVAWSAYMLVLGCNIYVLNRSQL
jgi:tryptophan-rich sensory protein